MTALIGILNRSAAVIASDSAETDKLSDNSIIYNNCHKIFPLSDTAPVALMLYNETHFMDVPWNVIINLYRKNNGNKRFESVKDACEDFLGFVMSNEHFLSKDFQNEYFLDELHAVYYQVFHEAQSQTDSEVSMNNFMGIEEQSSIFRRNYLRCIEKEINKVKAKQRLKTFVGYTYKKYLQQTAALWDEFEGEYIEKRLEDDLRKILKRMVFEYLISGVFYNGTGLVFVGYGEKDMFPSNYTVEVSGIFDNRLRYRVIDEGAVSTDGKGMVKTYAQDDVMITLMEGIAPKLHFLIAERVKQVLQAQKETLLDNAIESGASDRVINKLKGVASDKFCNMVEKSILQYISENYQEGLSDAVDSFMEDDMVEMAEKMISITNFQRRITSRRETVGGPIEVAVISKCDGFRWVKHHLQR